jgi:hypothetical protein
MKRLLEIFQILDQRHETRESVDENDPLIAELRLLVANNPEYAEAAENAISAASPEARAPESEDFDEEEDRALFPLAAGERKEDDWEEPIKFVDKEEDELDPEKDIDIPVPKLPTHQIDLPEEPELIRVTTNVWDPVTGSFVMRDLGEMLLVPTGCEEPEYLSPYENTVYFRSALPRDKAVDANLYAAYQKMGIASRDWIRDNMDEDFDNMLEDKRIADDVPILMALAGKAENSGVAQTAGLEGGGDNNGAPLPPGPGPGRGNKNVPGDDGAS